MQSEDRIRGQLCPVGCIMFARKTPVAKVTRTGIFHQAVFKSILDDLSGQSMPVIIKLNTV